MARKPLTRNQKVILQVLGVLVGLTGLALMVAQVVPQFRNPAPDMRWKVTLIAAFMILFGVETFTFHITRISGTAIQKILNRFTGTKLDEG